MYKHFSLLALVAALVLAACSSDDDLDAAATSDSDATSTYMAVNIYMSSDAATRSSSTVSSDGYETGTAAEYAIDFTNSIFLFYASDGSYLTGVTPEETSGTLSSTSTSSTDYAEYTTNAILVLGPTTLTPTCMVGVFNDAKSSNYKGMSLDELQEALFTSSNDDGTNLLMSNAVKYSDESFSFATEISSSNICESESLALSAPVNMYVERAKARVAIGVTEGNFTEDESAGTYTYTITKTGDNSGTDSTFTYYYVDEDGNLASVSDATVDITIKGWAVNAYNKTGYVIKNYTNNGTELSSDIKKVTDSDGNTIYGGAWGESWYSDLRIFWAVDGNYAAETSTDDSWGLKYWTWTDVTTQTTPCSTDAAYYYEQTLDPNATTGYDDGQIAYAPTLLVAATVGVSAENATEAEDSSDDADDIYLWYGSVLYSKQAVYAKILSIIEGLDGISLSDGESISSITWETQEASKGTVTIKSITMSGNTDVSSYIASINNNDFISNGTSESEATAYYLRKYEGGASYYQVPIQTYISSDDGSPYGLVRNTAYSITINSVTGIGAGVPDTEEELTEIPEKDKSGYLACTINVLAWRLSSQTVDL